MSEYLEFVREGYAGKTQIWGVLSKRRGDTLGTIRWYGAWRQYVFVPHNNTLFNVGCLSDINGFIGGLMAERRKPQP